MRFDKVPNAFKMTWVSVALLLWARQSENQ